MKQSQVFPFILCVVGIVLLLVSLVDDVFHLGFLPTWLNWVFYIVGGACAYGGMNMAEIENKNNK